VDYDPRRDANMEYAELVYIQEVRGLARSLAAEAKSARARGEYGVAAKYAVATMRLGAMLRRGGLLIDYLLGLANEGIGCWNLQELRRELSPDDSRSVIAALEKSLAEHEDLDSILARDAHFTHQVYGWRTRLEEALHWLLSVDSDVLTAVETAAYHSAALNRLLQADLAIRAFRTETGRWPADLEELAPAYLSAVPLDPYTDQPLQYRPGEDDFILYSVGFDGRDDGGAFTTSADYYTTREAAQRGWDLSLDFVAAEE
jgi:hypothetical protein